MFCCQDNPHTAMAETQSTDPQIRALQSSPESPLVVEAVPLTNSSHPLYCDTSTGTQRPLVPKHKPTQTCGWRPCHLFCSEFELPSKRTFHLQQLNGVWHNSPLTWRILHSYHKYHTQLKAHMQRIHLSPPW